LITSSRGKEQLVLIRPYKNGLALHTMYHAAGTEARPNDRHHGSPQAQHGENSSQKETGDGYDKEEKMCRRVLTVLELLNDSSHFYSLSIITSSL
jgi:hypothetical protein